MLEILHFVQNDGTSFEISPQTNTMINLLIKRMAENGPKHNPKGCLRHKINILDVMAKHIYLLNYLLC